MIIEFDGNKYSIIDVPKNTAYLSKIIQNKKQSVIGYDVNCRMNLRTEIDDDIVSIFLSDGLTDKLLQEEIIKKYGATKKGILKYK